MIGTSTTSPADRPLETSGWSSWFATEKVAPSTCASADASASSGVAAPVATLSAAAGTVPIEQLTLPLTGAEQAVDPGP